MQEWAEKFYKSKAWQNVRDYVYKRDAMLCQDCLHRGLYTPAVEVHHITPLTPDNINDPAVSLNPDNLVSLCKMCHTYRHTGKRWRVDQNGKVHTR